jgi:hypothetical protein
VQNKCNKCGKTNEARVPDKCLEGYLPGIAHACCGHGVERNAYCCGWDGCKPDELIGGYDEIKKDEDGYYVGVINRVDRPGWWIKRGRKAIEYMNSLGAKIP